MSYHPVSVTGASDALNALKYVNLADDKALKVQALVEKC